MSTPSPELERVITDALRGTQIADTDLIYPTLRTQVPRNSRRLAAALGTAAAVVIAAVAGVLVANRDGGQHQVASGDSLAGVVGHRWRVTDVVDDHGTLTIPASMHAEVGFTRDGYVLGDDTVNALQATYTRTATGYRADDGASTLVGSVSLNDVQKRTIAAVDDLFLATVDAATDAPPPLTVTVKLELNGQLTLDAQGVDLTLTRIGDQPDFFARPPSPTATRTPPARNAVLHELVARARSTATANQDPNATGEAVRTTYRDAQRVVLDGDTSTSPPPATPVWVIQLRGSFTCLECRHPPGPAPTGTAVVLIVNADTFEGYDYAVTKQPHDLASLGTVIELPL